MLITFLGNDTHLSKSLLKSTYCGSITFLGNGVHRQEGALVQMQLDTVKEKGTMRHMPRRAKNKKFDALEMKRRLQRETEQKLSQLSEKEQLRLLSQKFAHLKKAKKAA